MDKNRIKYIYFDLDNTLWDFKRNTVIALEKLYNEEVEKFKGLNIPFETFRDVYRRNNEEAWRAYERGELTPQGVKTRRFERTLEELGMISSFKGRDMNITYLNYLLGLPHLMNHAKEILNYLHPSYPLGILSNGFEKGQYAKMKSADILHYFKDIITSDGAELTKPDPEIFHYAIKRSGFLAKEIVYIGDDYFVDTIAANNVGIHGILLDPHDKIADPSIIKIKDLIELKKFL